ncbi:hypothetical protein chiPu_0001690 [Chiloscyllium punctatum]|uniref:Uncharacterized protein n=1 Tax=Chiloscyllium punctatum TaxID=137246 RepID=A0A401RYS8_CHIPU|nr:hypothetical protein [Chiloscyllium punctatum]
MLHSIWLLDWPGMFQHRLTGTRKALQSATPCVQIRAQGKRERARKSASERRERAAQETVSTGNPFDSKLGSHPTPHPLPRYLLLGTPLLMPKRLVLTRLAIAPSNVRLVPVKAKGSVCEQIIPHERRRTGRRE